LFWHLQNKALTFNQSIFIRSIQVAFFVKADQRRLMTLRTENIQMTHVHIFSSPTSWLGKEPAAVTKSSSHLDLLVDGETRDEAINDDCRSHKSAAGKNNFFFQECRLPAVGAVTPRRHFLTESSRVDAFASERRSQSK